MPEETPRPIIIKRKVVAGEDGHHGGAWKVAYADFVTAMMAFFLLMWLLNATTEKQRKGLADYFTPAIPISRVSGGGEDAFWGDSVFADDSLAYNDQDAVLMPRPIDAVRRGAVGPQVEAQASAAGAGNLTGAERLLEELEARGGESMAALKEMRHVVTRLTEEGLIIEIYEMPDVPLFTGPEGDAPSAVLRETLAMVATTVRMVVNDVAIEAHVPSVPVVQAEKPLWELTSARALSAGRVMEAAGFAPTRLRRLTGHADREPATDNPMARRNNRLEIVLLREDF